VEETQWQTAEDIAAAAAAAAAAADHAAVPALVSHSAGLSEELLRQLPDDAPRLGASDGFVQSDSDSISFVISSSSVNQSRSSSVCGEEIDDDSGNGISRSSSMASHCSFRAPSRSKSPGTGEARTLLHGECTLEKDAVGHICTDRHGHGPGDADGAPQMCAMCEKHLANIAELTAKLAAATQYTCFALAERAHEITALKARLAELEAGTGEAAPQPLSSTASSKDSCCKSLSTLCSTSASSSGCTTPGCGSSKRMATVPEPVPELHTLAKSSPHVGVWPACKIRCSAGHDLLATSMQPQPGMRWICDGCERDYENIPGRLRFRCSSCNFDLCEDCYSWRVQLVNGSTCPKGHLLGPPSPSQNTHSWICDKCQQDATTLPAASVSARRRCTRCDYDLCGDCHSSALSSSAATTMANGRRLSLPSSARHSCFSRTAAAQAVPPLDGVLSDPTGKAGSTRWAMAAATSAVAVALASAGSACTVAQCHTQAPLSCGPRLSSSPASFANACATGTDMGAAAVWRSRGGICSSYTAVGPLVGAVAGA